MGSKCWVNIPTDVVYKLKGICVKHTLHNRRCDGCPLEEPCRYKSDPSKSDKENRRMFETGLAAKLTEIEQKEMNRGGQKY